MPETYDGGSLPGWQDVDTYYWLENEVLLVFQLEATPPSGAQGIMEAIRLDDLNQFLNFYSYRLTPFGPEKLPPISAPGQQGQYLFPAPAGSGTTVVGFFSVSPVPTPVSDPGVITAWWSPNAGQSDACKVANLINANLAMLKRESRIPVVAAAPHWIGSATPCLVGSGPGVPPVPVASDESDQAAPGLWPIDLPAVRAAGSLLADKRGAGVHVFVLDTMPELSTQVHAQTLAAAAQEAGEHNRLLHVLASEASSMQESALYQRRYQQLPEETRFSPEYQPAAGRDIHGNAYSFHMPDHGLFVSGIIRDLVPEANIEHIRVLNDLGGGDLCTLMGALMAIAARMAVGGDLYQQPVVVNLSLVVGPDDELLPQIWYSQDDLAQVSTQSEVATELALLRTALHLVVQNLVAHGAVVVAAAGNDSNSPTVPKRIGPHYPAAFPEVISVAAVDRQGKPALYSNAPQSTTQHNGIATYGGAALTLEEVRNGHHLDALKGVYTAATYPALEAHDPALPDYPAPNTYGWAFWSGTSFATPIVSAVAARVLQALSSGATATSWASLSPECRAAEVQRLLMSAEGQQEIFGAALVLQADFGVTLLSAVQG